MDLGISTKDLKQILAVFERTSAVEEAIVFGSRAKGNYQPGSDLDIAVKGKEFTFKKFMTLLLRLDELEFLYKVDVVNYGSINNQDLLDHIDRVGVRLYSASDQPESSPEIR